MALRYRNGNVFETYRDVSVTMRYGIDGQRSAPKAGEGQELEGEKGVHKGRATKATQKSEMKHEDTTPDWLDPREMDEATDKISSVFVNTCTVVAANNITTIPGG